MSHTEHEYNHGGVCIFCGYERPTTTSESATWAKDEPKAKANRDWAEKLTTPTDNAEWLREILKWHTIQYANKSISTAEAIELIQAHIDTVCREAERQGGSDELMEMLDMCLTNYAKTKNNDMKTLADYCNIRLTQLNPNKDTPQ